MAIKDKFLEDVHINDRVELMVGRKELSGVVISLSKEFVEIRKDDGGQPTLSLDSISYYEVVDGNNTIDNNLSPYDRVISELEKRGSFEDVLIKNIRMADFHDLVDLESNEIIKKELGSIVESIDFAVKKNHEKYVTDYKISENITKVKRLINTYKNKSLYNFEAAIYQYFKADNVAMELYESGDDNISAFLLAKKLDNPGKMKQFAKRHLYHDEKYAKDILLFILKEIIINDKEDHLLEKIRLSKEILPARLAGYHYLARAILILNNISYDAKLDKDYVVSNCEELNNLIKKKVIKPEDSDHQVFVNEKYDGEKWQNFDKFFLLNEEKPVKDSPKSTVTARLTEEAPTFAAAEKARQEEKNKEKAKRLYKEAIQKNEKVDSAVANLFQLLFNENKYSECAKYLGKYGYNSMREKTYNNLKNTLLQKSPKCKAILEKYENEDQGRVADYFVMAQNADVKDKDLQKAISYYKLAIENNQRLSASIPNLASLYSRVEMYDEAIELLKTKGNKAMDRLSRLNLLKEIYHRTKDSRYEADVNALYDELRTFTNEKTKLNDLLVSQANCFIQMRLYDKALDLYIQALKDCTSEYYADEEALNKRRTFVLTNLITTSYRSGKKDEIDVKYYAEELLKIDSENEIAKGVLEGIIDFDVDIDSSFEEELELNESIGVVKNIYIEDRMNSLRLDTQIKEASLLEDDQFVGSLQDAERALKMIDAGTRKLDDETRSDLRLTRAKLIGQMLDKGVSSENFNEGRYATNLATGAYYYGEACLFRNNSNPDVARYMYTQPMNTYNNVTSFVFTWSMATLHYIQSFFATVNEIRNDDINDIYNYRRKMIIGSRFYTKIKRIMKKTLINSDVNNFVLGMMELILCNSRIRLEVLNNMYEHSSLPKVLDILSKILEKDIPDEELKREDFFKFFDEAMDGYYARRKVYLSTLSEAVENCFVVGELNKNLDSIRENDFSPFLNNTDRDYFKRFNDILDKILHYNEMAEFDPKADILSQVEDMRRRLEEDIQSYPTYLSYEKLRQMLRRLQVKVFLESADFYGNSSPSISVRLSGDCSKEADSNIVRVPLAFENKNNVQAADNVQINIGGDEIELINDKKLRRMFLPGDGKAKEELLSFRVSDRALKDQEISLVIDVHYQYKKNMSEFVEEEKSFIVTVPLDSDATFEPIENKFAGYTREVVKDEKMFYGRDKEIDNIIKQISGSDGKILRGRCLALYGQTRTGKSSLLFHLEKKLRSINPDNIIVNIGSIGETNPESNDITDFLYAIIYRLRSELRKNHRDLYEELEANGIVLDQNRLNADREHSLLHFNEMFKDFMEYIEEQNRNYNVIIMIDEFTYIYDWIRQGTMTDRIMKFWKAFIQNNNIFSIIIGQDHMMRFVSEEKFTNDFGSTDLWKVSYLSEEAAKKLMSEPIMYKNENGEMVSRYTDEALDRLYELTSGSAFLIMNLCAGLVDYLNEIHSAKITRAHIDDYLRKNLQNIEEPHYFEPQYNDKYYLETANGDPNNISSSTAIERNKQMLKKIALKSNKNEWTTINSVVENDEDRKTLAALEARDVIMSNRNRVKIKVGLYKEWLLEKYGLEN